MAKFMCTHTVKPRGFNRDQFTQLAQAAQQDPSVKGNRSFASLAGGKAVCVMEAADKELVAAWFTKMGLPFDPIKRAELEGEGGSIHAA